MHSHTPDFAQKVRASFAAQTVMALLGASLESVAKGSAEISLPYRSDLCQHNGFLHAGIVTTMLDSACGFAAFSLMPAGANVLSVEFKLNLLSPARGERFMARGRVVRSGRTLTICQGDAYAYRDGEQKHIATMLGTMMTVLPREDNDVA